MQDGKRFVKVVQEAYYGSISKVDDGDVFSDSACVIVSRLAHPDVLTLEEEEPRSETHHEKPRTESQQTSRYFGSFFAFVLRVIPYKWPGNWFPFKTKDWFTQVNRRSSIQESKVKT